MGFNVAMLKAMEAEGLDLSACIRVLEAGEKKADPTAAERKRRQRAKSQRDVTRDPPNDNNTLTPEVSEANASSPQPWACPVGVDPQVWADLLGNRKRKRQGCSPTAWKRFNDDLSRISALSGIPPPKLIEHAAAHGWAGIYDPRNQQHDRPAQGIGKTTAAIAGLGGFNDDSPM
jgi:hypothetical protein